MVLVDAGLDLHGSVVELLFGEFEEGELAEVGAIAAADHHADEVVFTAGGEGEHQEELGPDGLVAGQVGENVDGGHGGFAERGVG